MYRVSFFISWFLVQFALLAEIVAPVKLSQANKDFINSLPADFHYGWLEVPEDYQKPAGRKIHVFYYGTKPGLKKSVPIIVFNGGPGDGTHGYYFGLKNRLPKLNIIFMDQRGAGISTPYPAVKAENIKRYSFYLSDSIVKDAERLRQKLYKQRQWTIVGHSFGSIIAHRYIAEFPQSLHSAHAHGWSLISHPQKYPELRLLAHKKCLDDYFKTYPNDRKLVAKLTASLTENDFIQSGDIKLRGRAIADFLSLFTFGMKNTWPHFHNYLNTHFIVNGQVNREAFKGFAARYFFEFMKFNSKMALINIVFNRQEAYVTGKQSLSAFYKDIFKRLEKSGNDPYKWEIGEEAFAHFGLDNPVLKLADKMPLGPYKFLKPDDVFKGLEKNKSLKFYLYSSSFDAFSPPEIYREMAFEKHSRLFYKNFKKSGHEGIFTESEIWDKVEAMTAVKKLEKTQQ